MKYYHSVFKELHFDYGRMVWSLNHIPFFDAMISVCDHRNMDSLHSLTFYAFLRVLTKGKIRRKQADAIFALIDISANGEIGFSELAFLAGIIVAQKDHLEREFLYMHAWKIWVTFNENGVDKVTTQEFRKTGLFFDFDYPTIYHMFRDYNWDDDHSIEFARFRFYLISCIHVRATRRAAAKLIRYQKFKHDVLDALSIPLGKVLRDNIYPAPKTILRSLRTIKIPPLEGQETIYHWSDVLTLKWMRNAVYTQWSVMKMKLLLLMDTSPCFRWCMKIFCCGLCCFGLNEDLERARKRCANCGKVCWNSYCLICCCCACCGACWAKITRRENKVKPMKTKPVVIRRQVEIDLVEAEKKNMENSEPVVYKHQNKLDVMKTFERCNCSIQ